MSKEVVKGKNLFDEEKIIDTGMKEPLFVRIPFDEYKKLQEEIEKLKKENAELKEDITEIEISKDKLAEDIKDYVEKVAELTYRVYSANMKKKHEDKKKADMNKLINYIAIRENKTHEDICKEFDI